MEMGESADFDVCIEKNNEYHHLMGKFNNLNIYINL
jgi:hypothetical protein